MGVIKKKAAIAITIAVMIIACAVFLWLKPDEPEFYADYGYTEFNGYAPEDSYLAYLNRYLDAEFPDEKIQIAAAEYRNAEGDVQLLSEYEGEEDVLFTGEDGLAEWSVTIPQTGLWQIKVDYLACGGNGLSVERTVYIDGELPYTEAEYLVFPRCFRDVTAQPSKDLDGNDIRPRQEEVPLWQSKMLTDASGYYSEPLSFYMTEGEHTLRFISEREPLYIKNITFCQAQKQPSYNEYIKQYQEMDSADVPGSITIIQAENMYLKSERSNYPINDRTSSYTQPQDANAILLNSMGGTRWQRVGSSSSWIVRVDKSGLYRLAPRYKQNYISGMNVYRRLLVNGEVPFQEAGCIGFSYDADWQCEALGNGTEEYLFYFEEGKEYVLEMSEQPLALDYLALVPAEEKIPEAEGNILEKIAYQAKLFMASFTMDYSRMGITEDSEGDGQTIRVWLATGRDQMNTIRNLINSDFTKEKGITVELELVSAGTLLPSVLAGTGPDVALSNGIGDPINLALRNAAYDLTSFPDYEEVTERFPDSVLIPYRYQGKNYALPETVSFNMMFYRKDIFEEMGLTVPGTWKEWDAVISELSKKNMEIGLPHDLNMLLTFMYQNGCELYNGEGESVNLDSRDAVRAFEKLSEYYTLYNFPTEYDFVNCFRSGEMPLAIADYTIYNQLSLFAPEIRGEWEMALVPGTVQEDGTIDRTTTFTGTASVILGNTEHADAAWEFLKWWTSTEVQAAYCNEMESTINASAKQATANLEALQQLPWEKNDLNHLLEAWGNLQGTPEVPGGYYVGRTYTFAFNKVVNDKEDPTDTLQKYIEPMNSELIRKRREFGNLEQGGEYE